jgi:hypothetical protein
MKKLFLSFMLVTFISTIVLAQAKIGVQAGAAIASYKEKYQSESENSDGKVGLTAGVVVEVPVADQFAFQPALNYIQKGGKQKFNGSEAKVLLNYMELLLNFLYKAPAGDGQFFAGLGPSLALGMSGKYKEDGEPDEDIEFGNDEDSDDVKPLEIGGNILAGYQFAMGLYIALNYNIGLNNLSPGGNDDFSLKNRYFGIRIGYFLSQMKK